MNTSVTLSARALLAGLLALLVVVGAYLLGQAGTQEAVAAPVAGGVAASAEDLARGVGPGHPHHDGRG